MNSAAIAETNRLRVSLGMKPLPVPGETGPQFREKSASDEDDGEEPASTLETRQAAAYDNYVKLQEAEDAKKRRERQKEAIKKARDTARRHEELEGKGLAEEAGEVDTKAWLKSQKKRQKEIEKARKLEAERAAAEAEAAAAIQYTSKDLAGVKVAHEASAFEDGDEQILTLKDSNVVGDEDSGNELENVSLRDREKLNERLELKKKKPVYDPNAVDDSGDRSILAQYDEEINGKKAKKFTLGAQGTIFQPDEVKGQPQSRQVEKMNLDIFKDEPPPSDYLDISEIKIKKPKKKKNKTTRQRADDDDALFPAAAAEPTPQDQSMDIDSGAGFVIGKKRKAEVSTIADDEDLQATLALQRRDALKKRKRTRPEDIARQLREEAQTPEGENGNNEAESGGLVIDEISEFVSGLKKEDVEERKPRKPKTPNPETVTTMGDESDEDTQMRDVHDGQDALQQSESLAAADVDTAGIEEEKTIDKGIGAALQLLKGRNLLQQSDAAEKNERLRRQAAFLADMKRIEKESEQEARDQRERDRQDSRISKMSARDREEYARQQNNTRDQRAARKKFELMKTYQPNVELKHVDEHGRSLDQKEAFKHLSHQFHGKGSGKGKTDKLLKKIEDEKRRESQSMLDSSQNVGMSSATAQQTKKNKAAGVRLA